MLRIIILFLITINVAWSKVTDLSDGKNVNGVKYPRMIAAISKKKHAAVVVVCNELNDSSGDIECKVKKKSIFKIGTERNQKLLEDFKSDIEFSKMTEVMKYACSDSGNVNGLKSRVLSSDVRNGNHRLSDIVNGVCEMVKNGRTKQYRAQRISEIEHDIELDKQTCAIEAKTSTQLFTYNASSGQWIYQSRPYDVCGVIEVAYIDNVDNHSWNYITKKIITNKSGSDFLGSCSKLSENDPIEFYGDMLSSGYNQIQLINCKYLNFGYDTQWS